MQTQSQEKGNFPFSAHTLQLFLFHNFASVNGGGANADASPNKTRNKRACAPSSLASLASLVSMV